MSRLDEMGKQLRRNNDVLQSDRWPGWGLVIGEVIRPIVGLGLLAFVLRGSHVASWVLAFFLVIRLVRLITARVPQWREMRAEREDDEAMAPWREAFPMPVCAVLCPCGCGNLQDDTLPFADCEKPCACGCLRPCWRHVGHAGGCAGRPGCVECAS